MLFPALGEKNFLTLSFGCKFRYSSMGHLPVIPSQTLICLHTPFSFFFAFFFSKKMLEVREILESLSWTIVVASVLVCIR